VNDPHVRLRILVVGAGIAGLGVARALRLQGFAPDVVERQPTWEHAGTGIYLPGNAARALRELGLESAVRNRAARIPRQRICDSRGRVLTDIDLDALWTSVGPCLALHRADLHDVLSAHGGQVPIRMGTSVRSVAQRDDATVAVQYADGSADRYDLVIGADGIHSTVRRLVFGKGAVHPVGQLAWRFVTACPAEITTWTAFLGRGVTFLAVPIGAGQVYCYCDTGIVRGSDGDRDDATLRLRKLLAGFATPVPALLEGIGPETAVHFAPIEEVRLDHWARGSVLLVGDAAHATSPNMAEGAAMALEDALILADCLATERGIPHALAQFHARRRPRTAWVQAQTHRRDRTRNLFPPVRNFVLRHRGRTISYANYRPLLDVP
jgi:FAD-dependent urate hydroxylase